MAVGNVNLLRRGVDVTHSALSRANSQIGQLSVVPSWAWVLVFLTVLAFSLLIYTCLYSYLCVVGVLTTIETAPTNAYAPVESRLSSDEKVGAESETSKPLLEPEVVLVKSTPITSSIRRTIIHLRSKYGFLSRFRGFSLYFCLNAAQGCVSQALCNLPFMRSFVGLVVASIATDILFARWQMAWVHIIISEPTNQRWWKRALPLKSWAKIAPAMALYSIASNFTTVLPLVVAAKSGAFDIFFDPASNPTTDDFKTAFAVGAPIALLSLATAILVLIPAAVVFVRVAASMLPANVDTVVPFDRSFGGRVVPAASGGQGKVGLVDAWKSFSWSARFRLLKLIGKVEAIMAVIYISLALTLVAEAYLVVATL